jgi:hypothetical protein
MTLSHLIAMMRVYENKALPAKWLYWEDDPSLPDLLSSGDIVDLGIHGKHNLFMRRTDYYAGVLTNFVLFTLPTAEPVETFTAPATPGKPVSSPTSSNLKMFPASRQPLLQSPPGILPLPPP